jgi:hypothetical protein
MSSATLAGLARDRERPWRGFVAVVCLLFSPLLLFYSAGAEVYVSELAGVTLVALAALRTVNGQSPVWLAAAFAAAALFKLSSALLLVPLILYSLARAPVASRRTALTALAVATAIVAGVFLLMQPHYLTVVWEQFTVATDRTRLFGSDSAGFGRTLNRNVRDTFLACVSAAGFHVVGCVGWLVRSRRAPAPLTRGMMWVWSLPWLLVLTLVHIGKPGYALPLAPVIALMAAEWYVQAGSIGVVVACIAATLNLGWFLFLPPSHASQDTRAYRDKPMLARLASDAEPLTFPTRATIRSSDRAVGAMLDAVATCPERTWVLLSGSRGVDWRRTMVYVPAATTVQVTDDQTFGFVGHEGTFASVTEPQPIVSPCGLLWLGTDPSTVISTSSPTRVPEVGLVLPPGSGTVSPGELRWNAMPSDREP